MQHFFFFFDIVFLYIFHGLGNARRLEECVRTFIAFTRTDRNTLGRFRNLFFFFIILQKVLYNRHS